MTCAVVLGGSISALDFFDAYPPTVLEWLRAAFPVNADSGAGDGRGSDAGGGGALDGPAAETRDGNRSDSGALEHRLQLSAVGGARSVDFVSCLQDNVHLNADLIVVRILL